MPFIREPDNPPRATRIPLKKIIPDYGDRLPHPEKKEVDVGEKGAGFQVILGIRILHLLSI